MTKTIQVTEETWRRLKLLSLERGRSIGALIGELVEREVPSAALGRRESFVRSVRELKVELEE